MSGSAGLEGRSRNRLEDGLAPLDAEGRHDGGSEGALRGCGQSMAHEGGAESSHGEYGVVVSGEWRLGGGGGGGGGSVVVLHSAMLYACSRRYTERTKADDEDSRGESLGAFASVKF